MRAAESEQDFTSLPFAPDWSFAELNAKDTSEGTHAYHSYPMRFVPQLARKLLDEYSQPDDLVVDPFMGSGTTIVEAAMKGHAAVGIDVNPIAKLITDAKITAVEPLVLDKATDRLLKRLSENRAREPIQFDQSVSARIDFWFPPLQREQLEALLTAITLEPNAKARLLFLCAFSSILKKCSLWYPGSTKAIRSEKRRRNPEDPYRAMSNHLRLMTERNQQLYEFWGPHSARTRPAIRTYRQDVRRLKLPPSSADLMITSPPYVTSYDYAELHQLSLLWLGYATTYQDVRGSFVGTTHGVSSAPKPEMIRNWSLLAGDTVDSMLSSRAQPHLNRAVAGYFADMWVFLGNIRRVLKPRGRLVLVIGNTVLRGVLIRNAEVLAEMGANLGFTQVDVIKRQIPLKSIPQRRNPQNGQFASGTNGVTNVYPEEYVLVLETPT